MQILRVVVVLLPEELGFELAASLEEISSLVAFSLPEPVAFLLPGKIGFCICRRAFFRSFFSLSIATSIALSAASIVGYRFQSFVAGIALLFSVAIGYHVKAYSAASPLSPP